MRWANLTTIGVGAVVVAGMMAINYHGVKVMQDQSDRVYLWLYGSAIYEYHNQTGKWPSKIEDLAGTSLPRQNPDWKIQLDIQADVIVWPKDLRPSPEDNGQRILVYHNKGVDVEVGRIWVCWGDLRTECITPEELRGRLKQQ